MIKHKQGRPVIKGMYHLFLGNTLTFFVVGISSIAVARLLGPEQYGLYGLALVAEGYLYAVIELNIPAAAIRYSAKYKSEGSADQATSFAYSLTLFQLFLAGAAFLLALPFSGIIADDLLKRPQLVVFIPIATASVVGDALQYVTSSGFQGLGQMNKSALISVTGAFARLSVSVSLILLGFSIFGALAGYTTGLLISGMTGLVLIVAARKSLFPRNFFQAIRTSMGYSLPLTAITTIGLFLGPYQNTLLANFASNQGIAGYFAATNLALIVGLVGTPITAALFPLFSSFGENKASLLDAYTSSVKYEALFLVPATLLVMALSTPIASVIYGNEFGFAGYYFAALVSPYLLVGFGSLSQGAVLNGIGETRKSMLIGVAAMVVITVNSTILIPLLQVYGVIIADLTGTIISLILSSIIISRIFGRRILVLSVAKIYLAAAVAAGLIYPLVLLGIGTVPALLLGIPLFLSVYIPLLALTRALTEKELRMLEVYFKNVGPLSTLLRPFIRYYRIFANQRDIVAK